MSDDKIGLRFKGHVLIRYDDTKEVIHDIYNAIHLENCSYALALALADRSNGHIQTMVFGNGGSVVSAVGQISYLPPNITGSTAQLYNQTYTKVVDDQSPLDLDPNNNYMTVNHTTGTTYSDIQITCKLGYNEPSGQAAYDDASVVNGTTSGADPTGTYIFDELGLMTFNAATNSGLLLSHVIFHPVQKALNRSIEIVYTIRIILN